MSKRTGKLTTLPTSKNKMKTAETDPDGRIGYHPKASTTPRRRWFVGHEFTLSTTVYTSRIALDLSGLATTSTTTICHGPSDSLRRLHSGRPSRTHRDHRSLDVSMNSTFVPTWTIRATSWPSWTPAIFAGRNARSSGPRQAFASVGELITSGTEIHAAELLLPTTLNEEVVMACLTQGLARQSAEALCQ